MQNVTGTYTIKFPDTRDIAKVKLFNASTSNPTCGQVRGVIKLLKLIRVFDREATPKFGSVESARHLWSVVRKIPAVKNYFKQNHQHFRQCSEIFDVIKNIFLKNVHVILDQAAERIMKYRNFCKGNVVKQVCLYSLYLQAIYI